MKYAITGPQGGINRISDTEPQNVPEQATVVEITDEQAAIVQAGREATPRVIYFLIEGKLKTRAERMEIRRAEREAAIEAERLAAMTPEERQLELTKKAAWDAAAAAFEALPLGKQALWEPVRVKVADFIMAGDFAAAVETIATVPNLYEGMQADKDIFLALFQ